VQETFLEAQRDFAAFQGSSEAEWRAWLRQMLVHNLANFVRRFRDTDKREVAREVTLAGGSASQWDEDQPASRNPTPSVEMMAEERALAVAAAIDRLPEDYRQVIALRYQEGCSFDEIAALMQRSDNAVRKLWFRAIERLEQELEKCP
jgi:RNA polymerase sigma-70 factor, ECF subfamily